AGLDVGQQAAQGGPVHVAAGEAAVVVALRQAGPALVALAGDEGRAGLTLGVQAVERLLGPLLGLPAGGDRATGPGQGGRGRRRLAVGLVHQSPPLPVSRKKRKPLQWLPVTALATALRER